MLYCNESKKIFHVHIPRTGGRYVKNLFVKNSYDFYFYDYDTTYKGIEIPHLHYPLYLDLEYINECEHFTIIRNPFEKFKSTIQILIRARGYPEEIYEKIKDKDWLFSFLDMDKVCDSYITNWFRSQKEFVSEKTKIWRFENGLGKEYIKWINKNFNTSLKEFNSIEYPRVGAELLPIKKEIDQSVEELIKEYYAEDYEHFNY